MIDLPLEVITAEMAINYGLLAAFKRGETVISGSYSASKDYGVSFKHNPFTFTDKNGILRYVEFANVYEVLDFQKTFIDTLDENQKEKLLEEKIKKWRS